jgi:2-polyprenyl-3-methyl-5-hydroxy-6-metoxy-1,4-benzoquinol methylase
VTTSSRIDVGRLREDALAQEAARLARVEQARDASSKLVCDNCGSDDLELEGSFPAESKQLQVHRCRACALSQLDRRFSATEVADLEDVNVAYQDSNPDVEAQVEAHSFIVELIERYVPCGRLLEVGCSRGYKLEAARRAGWAVQGIELSPESCRFARETLGLPVHEGSLESFECDEPFDAVVAWHVLEHVPSALGFLSLLRAFTRPGGYIFLQMPSYERYRRLEPWSSHPSCFNEVHFWYFTAASLERLAVEVGFRPVYVLDDARTLHLTLVAERT